MITNDFMRKPLPKKQPYPTLFENSDYRIKKIPLNYQIDILVKKEVEEKGKKIQQRILPEMIYIPLDRGLEYAKEAAEYYIKKYA